jgi:hypothetical protein
MITLPCGHRVSEASLLALLDSDVVLADPRIKSALARRVGSHRVKPTGGKREGAGRPPLCGGCGTCANCLRRAKAVK